MAGAAAGELGLYITLSETEDELRSSAASHGWKLEGINVFELLPPENLLSVEQQQSLLYSSDLELGETTKRIIEVFEASSRIGSYWTAFRRSGCSRRGRCVIAARSWR